MGRYVYNSGQVTQAIDRLNEAIKAVTDVNTEIQVGIDEINNATGAQCIEIDYSKLLQLQPMAEEVIEENVQEENKVTLKRDYLNKYMGFVLEDEKVASILESSLCISTDLGSSGLINCIVNG